MKTLERIFVPVRKRPWGGLADAAVCLREFFTVAVPSRLYKVSRCSELRRFDCSPDPEDLHGPFP